MTGVKHFLNSLTLTHLNMRVFITFTVNPDSPRITMVVVLDLNEESIWSLFCTAGKFLLMLQTCKRLRALGMSDEIMRTGTRPNIGIHIHADFTHLQRAISTRAQPDVAFLLRNTRFMSVTRWGGASFTDPTELFDAMRIVLQESQALDRVCLEAVKMSRKEMYDIAIEPMSRLTHLGLQSCKFGYTSGLEFAHGLLAATNLQILNLSKCSMGYFGNMDSNLADMTVDRIAQSLVHNQSLTRLDLSYNLITKLDPLLNAFASLTSLVELHLNGSSLRTAYMQLTNIMTNKNYDHLIDSSVDKSALTAHGDWKIMPNVTTRWESMHYLGLEFCDITEVQMQILALGFNRLQNLQFLNLSENKIRNAGAIALSTSLRGTPDLRTLLLSNNEIRCTGLKHVAQALQFVTSLTNLDLSHNYMSASVAGTLSLTLMHTTCMITLRLNSNEIGYRGAELIIISLMNHMQRLRTLSISYNKFKMGDPAKLRAIVIQKFPGATDTTKNAMRDALRFPITRT